MKIKNKSKKNKKGGSCSVTPSAKVPDCIPEFNAIQYKEPCAYLPLDGPKQNTYPLSHNPPLKGGSKKKSLKKKKGKKGGFLTTVISQAQKLAVPFSLMAAKEVLKSKKNKNKNKNKNKKN